MRRPIRVKKFFLFLLFPSFLWGTPSGRNRPHALSLAIPEEAFLRSGEVFRAARSRQGRVFAAKRTLYGEDRSERIPLEGIADSPDSLQIVRLPTRKPEYLFLFFGSAKTPLSPPFHPHSC